MHVGRTFVIRLVVLPGASALSYADLEYRRCSDRLVHSPADEGVGADVADTPVSGDGEDGTSDGTSLPEPGSRVDAATAALRSLRSDGGSVRSGAHSGGTRPSSRQDAENEDTACSAPPRSAATASAGVPFPPSPAAARFRTAPLQFGKSRVVARACLGGGAGEEDPAADAMSDGTRATRAKEGPVHLAINPARALTADADSGAEARDHVLHATNLAVGTGAPPVVLLLPVGLRDTGLLTPGEAHRRSSTPPSDAVCSHTLRFPLCLHQRSSG